MCKISVLIPVYNTEKYLKKCLDSVINQTLEDIEIIIVNDGSKDNSQKIIDEYARKDNRIKYYIQENSGLGATRNKGIELATGEYIAFLDSDDWVENEYYELMYNNAIQSNSDIVISDYIVDTYNVSTIYKNEYNEHSKEDYLKEVAMRNTSAFSWNKLYKRKLIIENNLSFPIRDNFENIEDQYFTIKTIYLAKNISFLNIPLIHYIVRDNSIVNAYQKNLVLDGLNFYNQMNEFFKKHNASNDLYEALEIGMLKHICQSLSNECKSSNKKTLNHRLNEFRKIRNINEYKYLLDKFIANKFTEIKIEKYISKEQNLYFRLLRNNSIIPLYLVKFIRIKSILIRTKFNQG